MLAGIQTCTVRQNSSGQVKTWGTACYADTDMLQLTTTTASYTAKLQSGLVGTIEHMLNHYGTCSQTNGFCTLPICIFEIDVTQSAGQ